MTSNMENVSIWWCHMWKNVMRHYHWYMTLVPDEFQTCWTFLLINEGTVLIMSFPLYWCLWWFSNLLQRTFHRAIEILIFHWKIWNLWGDFFYPFLLSICNILPMLILSQEQNLHTFRYVKVETAFLREYHIFVMPKLSFLFGHIHEALSVILIFVWQIYQQGWF